MVLWAETKCGELFNSWPKNGVGRPEKIINLDKNLVQQPKMEMNESEYVSFLYKIRGLNDLPQDVLKNLGTVI